MIEFNLKKPCSPIKIFKKIYDKTYPIKNIEAFCLSTCGNNLRPSSRFVNIKFITDNSLIFFSNYQSRKSQQIEENGNVSGVFFWNNVDIQIRVEGVIYKLDERLSDKHFQNRLHEKNILAISSRQSQRIESYEKVLEKYKENLKIHHKTKTKRPSYWGGYEIIPNLFEFWYGHKNRLNKREVFGLENDKWKKSILEP